MNRDTLIGIVGAVVLVAAMAGVFYYERGVAAAQIDGAGGEGMGLTPPAIASTVALGQSDAKTVNITTATESVTFHLTWTATNGKDTLQLVVTPPAGSGITGGELSQADDAGDITITVPIPEGGSAIGLWQVSVEFVKAEPAPLPGGIPPPTPPPNSTDTSVKYNLTTTLA